MSKWAYPFDADRNVIDLREMQKNYGNKPIPFDDIHKEIKKVIPGLTTKGIDPDRDRPEFPPLDGTSDPQMQWHTSDELYLESRVQRNTIPKNIANIYDSFRTQANLPIQVVKITMDGQVYRLIYESHHSAHGSKAVGYSRFKCSVIDVDAISDKQMIEEFHTDKEEPLSDEERYDYCVWLAGTIFLDINYNNKQVVSEYDRFMVQLSIYHPQSIAINNIFKKNGCEVVRKVRKGANTGGDIVQIKTMEELYEIETDQGVKGKFLDRALAFQMDNWKNHSIELELVRPMALIYAQAEVNGIVLDKDFDINLAQELKKAYEYPEKIQRSLKESYEEAVEDKKSDFHNYAERLPTHNKHRMVAALINFYKQKVKTPSTRLAPEQTWTIK